MAGLGNLDQIDLISVGMDVGSSTSHLVFSHLILRQNNLSASHRFEVVERKILYEGRIINTPLLDNNTIDIDEISNFFKEEYVRSGIKAEDINTGAVIVTGETAKKENAKQIVEQLSEDAGKFVAATAGPNFESLIAAMGSGMTKRSQEKDNTILSIDIGGGTSNLAISHKGEVISTCCISVGGRLIAIDKNNTITRMDDPAKHVLDNLNMFYDVGDVLNDDEIRKITDKFAEVLLEVSNGPTTSQLAKKLMMTEDLDFSIPINEISFSGGVGELIYNNSEQEFDDIGKSLASSVNNLCNKFNAIIIEPQNKIRATVIGAGAYSLSISGSTGYLDENLKFPLRNIPVLRVDVDRTKLSLEHVKQQIDLTFNRFDISEGEDTVALYFKDPVRPSYERLKTFALSIENSLRQSIDAKIPIILIFEKDIANSVGNIIRRETEIKENLLTLDELFLSESDWIDIGDPLINGQVFPITVKSLVFQKTN